MDIISKFIAINASYILRYSIQKKRLLSFGMGGWSMMIDTDRTWKYLLSWIAHSKQCLDTICGEETDNWNKYHRDTGHILSLSEKAREGIDRAILVLKDIKTAEDEGGAWKFA